MEKLRRVGFSKLTSLDEALDKLFSRIKLNPIEEVLVSDSLNRILAEDIKSEINVPPFDRSAMDGYAIKAEDSFGASPKNPKKIKLIGIVEIGETSEVRVNKGEGVRISTGAAIPEGAEAVIKIEDTEIEAEIVRLYAPLTPGKNVSKEGEDIQKGARVLNQGIEIKSEHIALLTSLGFEKVNVRVKPKTSVFASGDELIEPGKPLESNKIYNSNTPMISTLVKIYGGSIVRGKTLPDKKDVIKSQLVEAFEDSQIVIFTGGTSVGTKDYLPEVMYEMGDVLTHGIAMRPGSPILIGIINASLIFCLPGTPVAAYICFLKVVGPAIRKMMGSLVLDPRIELNATLNRDVPVSSLGFLNFLRVKIEKLENEFIAVPIKLKGSGVISSLTQSDGIVEIPPHQEGLKKGAKIRVYLFPK